MSGAPQLGRAIPVLPCLDIARAVEFYAEHLGFGMSFRFDDYAAVARDGVEIHLRLFKGSKAPNGGGCRIEVQGIESLFEECSNSGVVLGNGTLEGGTSSVREFAVQDGDGNLITFAEDPTSPAGD
jgi:catechol 2,3-dioxygenase-like lactoylglutathione lyase family enzyme